MGNDERYRWDRVAETWDSTTASRRNPHYHYYRTTDLLVVQLLRAANAQRALELGGGTAGCAIYALQALKKNADLHITSIDISPRMIELGQHKVKQAGLEDRITLQVGNASTLSYPNDSFDVVFSRGGVLSYSQHPEQLLQSAYRVLRVDGTLGIDVLPKPPEKKGYYLGKLEGFEKINGNCQNFQEPFTYREFFTEGEYQVLREYLIAPETQLSDEVKRQFQALP
ncbi:MAG: class I SAM-dependent methyltransferase, partial [Candidatus Hodarchaeales archaeon]